VRRKEEEMKGGAGRVPKESVMSFSENSFKKYTGCKCTNTRFRPGALPRTPLGELTTLPQTL